MWKGKERKKWKHYISIYICDPSFIFELVAGRSAVPAPPSSWLVDKLRQSELGLPDSLPQALFLFYCIFSIFLLHCVRSFFPLSLCVYICWHFLFFSLFLEGEMISFFFSLFLVVSSLQSVFSFSLCLLYFLSLSLSPFPLSFLSMLGFCPSYPYSLFSFILIHLHRNDPSTLHSSENGRTVNNNVWKKKAIGFSLFSGHFRRCDCFCHSTSNARFCFYLFVWNGFYCEPKKTLQSFFHFHIHCEYIFFLSVLCG